MSFPPAHFLIGAALADVATANTTLPRWRTRALAGFLAVSPDFDIVIGLLMGRGGAYHGTFSHSISAVVVLTLTAYALAGPRWAAVSGIGYGSHLLVDMLDDTGPTNLMLGWPFTGAHPYAIGKFFPRVRFETGGGFREALFSLFQPDTFGQLVKQTAVGGAVAAILVGIAYTMRRRFSAPGSH
jgi:membrane-bound metal-dependent hydrolase YbcI (DUF457 family)